MNCDIIITIDNSAEEQTVHADLPEAEVKTLANKLRSLLRPGGRVVIRPESRQ